MIKYIVTLSKTEHEQLIEIISKGVQHYMKPLSPKKQKEYGIGLNLFIHQSMAVG